jgi:hypothetical protein
MFTSYLKLGFEHILDPNGLDHVLFILVLTVPFFLKDWKKVVLLATAFTIGHSLTLALASSNIIKVNSAMVEILIAVTIFITAVFNIVEVNKNKVSVKYATALIFGLIHGMGFSNFFKTILGKDEILLPLFAFNIGVELAQIVIVLMTLVLGFISVQFFKIKQKYWVYGVSGIILLWALKMIIERI